MMKALSRGLGANSLRILMHFVSNLFQKCDAHVKQTPVQFQLVCACFRRYQHSLYF
jgi:hypothetical protein